MMRITYTGRKYDNVSGYIWLYDKLFIIGDTHTRTHAYCGSKSKLKKKKHIFYFICV